MSVIIYNSIGIIKTPYTSIGGMPIQPYAAKGVCGTIELNMKYVDGLQDLDGFQYIILLYHFHKVVDSKLKVIPFMDEKPHGIFATRAPVRPNPIGISVVHLVKIEKNILFIEDVDMLNDTPLLDIKPYVPKLDNRLSKNIGWLQGKGNIFQRKSDTRFITNKFYEDEKDSNTNKSGTS
jgi:tRNA (adenine37-N6)-methyltransferase